MTAECGSGIDIGEKQNDWIKANVLFTGAYVTAQRGQNRKTICSKQSKF